MIFYFSATGNSKYVATAIANKINDKTISITDCMKNKNLSFTVNEEESVGFVSPVYFWGLPTIVREFLQKIKLSCDKDTYVYFVSTYGTVTGQAPKQAHDILSKSGVKLLATFSVKTVDTYVPMFDLTDKNKINQTLEAAEKETEEIAEEIARRKTGNHAKDMLPCVLVNGFYPTYERKRKTSRFFVADTCVGCGLCARNCPVSAIEIKDGKPTWVKDKCVLCLSCLHRCPKAAIGYVRKNTHGQYVNPNAKT